MRIFSIKSQEKLSKILKKNWEIFDQTWRYFLGNIYRISSTLKRLYTKYEERDEILSYKIKAKFWVTKLRQNFELQNWGKILSNESWE